MDDDQREAFLKGHIASLKRLKAAGLIKAFGFGPGADDAWIEFDPAVTALMQAGRSPTTDPELWSLIDRGASPAEVRAWLGAAVAGLGTDDRRSRKASE